MGKVSRRGFIRGLGLGAAGLYASPLLLKSQAAKRIRSQLEGYASDPIQPIGDTLSPSRFLGDQSKKAHRALWNKRSFIASKGGIPEPSEEVPVVVVGGGTSGILSAYLLREHQPVLLEQAEQLGGNARAESWQGIPFSMGTSYFSPPDEGSRFDRLLDDLKIKNELRTVHSEKAAELEGRLYENYWENRALFRNARQQVDALHSYCRDIYDEENGLLYPYLPPLNAEGRKWIEALDRETLSQHLERLFGKLDPALETAVELITWSSFAASPREISAAGGLNFLSADFMPAVTLPGGNARLLQKAIEQTRQRNKGRDVFRARSLVLDVRVKDEHCEVTYLDSSDKLKTIRSRHVVMSCPKFVAKYLIDDLEQGRRQAMDRLKYRAYLVANLLVETPKQSALFGSYFLKDGKLGSQDPRTLANKFQATDACLSSFTQVDPQRLAITLYRPIPYDGARGEWFRPGAFSKVKREFERQIENHILPAFKLSQSEVKGLRIARWGHALPLHQQGLLNDGVYAELRKPYRSRVHFIEQDNWALPALETCVDEAFRLLPTL